MGSLNGQSDEALCNGQSAVIEAMDPAAFRSIMGSFPSGVTVITATDADGEPRGLTAVAFCSISLEPPISMVCVGKQSNTWPAIEKRSKFVVNILRDGQEDLAQRFASKSLDKFAGVGWRPGRVTGQPVLEDTLAYAEHVIWKVVDAGDHWVVLGHVVDGAVEPAASPLVYCRRSFKGWY